MQTRKQKLCRKHNWLLYRLTGHNAYGHVICSETVTPRAKELAARLRKDHAELLEEMKTRIYPDG